jgi:N-acetylneuraminic acid mutarotase
MNDAREGHTATLLNSGKILVTGGYNSSGGVTHALNTCEVYEPSSDTWMNTGSMNYARGGHAATLLDNGQVLVTGTGNISTMQYCELYTETGTWTASDSMNTGRVGFRATLIKRGEVLVAGGGDIGLNGLSSAELYKPFKR